MSDKALLRIRQALEQVPNPENHPTVSAVDDSVVKQLAKGMRQFFKGPMFGLVSRTVPDRLVVVLANDFGWAVSDPVADPNSQAVPGAADLAGVVASVRGVAATESGPGDATAEEPADGSSPADQQLTHLAAAAATIGCRVMPVAVELRRNPDDPEVYDAATAAAVDLESCPKDVVINEYRTAAGDVRQVTCHIPSDGYLDVSVPDHGHTTWREEIHSEDHVVLLGVQRVLGVVVFPEGAESRVLVHLDPLGFAHDIDTRRQEQSADVTGPVAAQVVAAADAWAGATSWQLAHNIGLVSLAQHSEVMAASLTLAEFSGDAELARKYLYSLQAEGLTVPYANQFGALVAQHGASWGCSLVKGWAAHMAQRELAIEWLVSLPEVSAALSDHPDVARVLVASCWHEVHARLGSLRDNRTPVDLSYAGYAEVVVAVLQSAVPHAGLVDELVAALQQVDSVHVCVETLIQVSASEVLQPHPGMQDWAETVTARLRELLATPEQATSDWSLPTVPAGRDAVLHELNGFLEDTAAQKYQCDWSLADRWNAMKVLSSQRLPVTVGSTLPKGEGRTVLTKADDMHVGIHATRAGHADLLARLEAAWPTS